MEYVWVGFRNTVNTYIKVVCSSLVSNIKKFNNDNDLTDDEKADKWAVAVKTLTLVVASVKIYNNRTNLRTRIRVSHQFKILPHSMYVRKK